MSTTRRPRVVLDLPLRLERGGSQSSRVRAALRAAILAGRIPAGARLPSSRDLAGQLGLRRNAVVVAYEQLLSDGLVETRIGAGTFVTPHLPQAPARAEAAVALSPAAGPAPFALGRTNADPALLRRVLGNLVTNALRHTPPGGSIRVEVSPGAAGWQRLTVDDTGPGIPPELLPRVFERFAKGPGSEGSGLGLAIARDLVLAHGGTIAAHAPAEGGTRIEIELPTGP